MLPRTVGWQPPSRHILELQTDSSLLEGTVSVVFDLLFLATAELLIHFICSSHNLRVVYDTGSVLHLRPRTSPAFCVPLPAVAPCPSRLARALSLLLLLVTAAAVLLGFAINGRSDNEFTTVKRTLASIHSPPRPVTFDYAREYRVDAGQPATDVPRWLSPRLVALGMVDQCQICHYNRCDYLAYTLRDKDPGEELSDTHAVRKRLRAECVTKAAFKDDIVNWSSPRAQKNPRRHCHLERIDVPSDLPDVPMDGTPVVKQCDYVLHKTRCFRRKHGNMHCAIAGKLLNEQRMHLLVALNVTRPSGKDNFQKGFFEMSGVAVLTEEQIKQYLDGAAYLSSLRLAPEYKLDLMMFVHLTHNETLQRRDVTRERNVSDVDLRIAVPSVAVLLAIALLLAVTAIQGWVFAVYYKKRQYFNSFTSVPDVLELLLESEAHLNRGRRESSFSPAVGIRRDEARIGVQAPGEGHIGGATIDEAEVL